MNFGFRAVLQRNSQAHWGKSDPTYLFWLFGLFVLVVLRNSLTLIRLC